MDSQVLYWLKQELVNRVSQMDTKEFERIVDRILAEVVMEKLQELDKPREQRKT